MSETAAVESPQIGTVAASVDTTINPRTGEPRRPVLVWVATALFYLGTAVIAAGLLWTWWLSVAQWIEASWLHARVGAIEVAWDQVAPVRAGVAFAEFALMVLMASAALIAGYYAWRGYRWTRWAGLLAAAVCFAALLLNPVAWFGIPAVVVGAVLLWLPASRTFFSRWHLRRHPAVAAPVVVDEVYYGPLPRYR